MTVLLTADLDRTEAGRTPMDRALAEKADHYDKIPYSSKPFPQSHPARMAAVAALFGLKAPVLATARVLELGGASGGNLIPIAAAGHAHTVNCRRESSIWM